MTCCRHPWVVLDVQVPRNILYPMHMRCDLSPGLAQMVLILHSYQFYAHVVMTLVSDASDLS